MRLFENFLWALWRIELEKSHGLILLAPSLCQVENFLNYHVQNTSSISILALIYLQHSFNLNNRSVDTRKIFRKPFHIFNSGIHMDNIDFRCYFSGYKFNTHTDIISNIQTIDNTFTSVVAIQRTPKVCWCCCQMLGKKARVHPRMRWKDSI